jgi:hypothetical protein
LFALTPHNAVLYLTGRIPGGDWQVRALGGGVSNTVLLAERGAERLVLKQALGKLRVQQDWFADQTRIHRESAAIRRLAAFLPPDAVPAVVFEDHANFIYAMTAAPAAARDWKSLLLAGELREEIAARAGAILAAQFRSSWNDTGCEREFGDQTCFDQLRIDPYYRFTASRYPDLARRFEDQMTESSERRCCLVHGDYSPKNLLVCGSMVTVIDFEVIHYGDPSFDTAFLLNHLLLKSVHVPERAHEFARLARVFWQTLLDEFPAAPDWLEAATIRHLGCLHLARVDGKSPAEYLDEAGRQRVRTLARDLIANPPRALGEAWERAQQL